MQYKKAIALVMVATMLVGCGNNSKKTEKEEKVETKETTKTVKIGDYVTCKDSYTITVGDKLDATKACTINDKSYEPSIDLSTELDITKAGKGELTVTVTDNEGNIYARNIELIVKEKATPTPSPTPTPTPTPDTQANEQQATNNATSNNTNTYNDYSYSNSSTYVQPDTSSSSASNNTYVEEDDTIEFPITPNKNNSQSTTTESSTQYFMLSSGYTMDSASQACSAWGASKGSYNCEPIADGSGNYIGYRGTTN